MSDNLVGKQKQKSEILALRQFSEKVDRKLRCLSPEKTSPNSQGLWSSRESRTKIPKETKTVFLELKNKKTFEIPVKVSEEHDLTVGWLLSEAIRKMKDYYESKSLDSVESGQVLFLASADKNYNLDYYLTFLDRNISVLRDGQTLTPFYGDPAFQITDGKKISLNYFQFQKMIGIGGFSQVILGSYLNSVNF